MRPIAAASAAALLSLPLSATARPALPRISADASSHAFDDAQFRDDDAALERFLAPDFLYVRGSGQVADRRTFLANLTDPTQHLGPVVITNKRIVSLGRDAMVVAADGVITGTAAGQPFREHFRYADTFVRRRERWQDFVQVTPVAP